MRKINWQRRMGMTLFALSTAAMTSCGASGNGGQAAIAEQSPAAFEREEMGRFEEPWAMAFEPGTGTLFVTEKPGHIRFRLADGRMGTVSGAPNVAYGGQGGLGDIAFAPDYASSRNIYLSWAEESGGKRGAAVGRAMLRCETALNCSLHGLRVIWRQTPKTDGYGHYSHRIAFSPDGKYLFVTSGDRQLGRPAQNPANTLGTIVRLLPDGTPAPGNPFADKGGATAQIWSYGHRNMLGIAFAPDGRLWEIEHGPRGGDELNLVTEGANYGWPVVSQGEHYDGRAIPPHAEQPQFAAPALSWNPVIAPGGMIFVQGDRFAGWQGQVLISGLSTESLVRVAIEGDTAREIARYPMGARVRALAEADDGSIWIAEDGSDARLWRLTPAAGAE